VDVLSKIWSQVRDVEGPEIVGIKNEIIYCIGNCTLGVRDSLSDSALAILKQALDQGALTILAEALAFKCHKMDADGLKITLDSLKRYFKFFKQAEKINHHQFGSVFQKLVMEFESLGGLDALEECQFHCDHMVFKMSQKILLKYFEPDSDGQPLLRLLNSVELLRPDSNSTEPSEILDSACPEDL
jgi:hypothetical protein